MVDKLMCACLRGHLLMSLTGNKVQVWYIRKLAFPFLLIMKLGGQVCVCWGGGLVRRGGLHFNVPLSRH